MERLTILVSGRLGSVPHQGGATWAVLQYVTGLRSLGHEVHIVEPVAESELIPAGASLPVSENGTYFQRVAETFRLGSATLLLAGTRRTLGLPHERLLDVAKRADLLLNISGVLREEAILERIPTRVYLDLDPAFTQLWHVAEGLDMGFEHHNRFVTVGLRLGADDCPIPTCELHWIPTVPPVVLDAWPSAPPDGATDLTTVANWRAYGSIEHEGRRYGQKAHSLRNFLALPSRARAPFRLALDIHPDEERDIRALRENGWQLVDPREAAGTPGRYQRFIQGSRAEFGIAKSGYVESRCGWFSDRSACYLASGRPVIAQDTGFGDDLPVGEGLFSFRSEGDVLDAIERIRSDYPRHVRAARAIAEEHFDADRVLTSLLEGVGGSP